MARLRAVVVSHPPGFGGSPSDGQRSLAMRNASWAISSAMSMSPKRRTRVATTRPASSRKMRVIAASSVGMTTSALGLVLERANLDRVTAGRRALRGPRQRRIEISSRDDPEAAELLFGLCVRPVGHNDVAVLDPHDGGGLRIVQSAGEDPRTCGAQLIVELIDLTEGLLRVFWTGGRGIEGIQDGEEILLHGDG